MAANPDKVFSEKETLRSLRRTVYVTGTYVDRHGMLPFFVSLEQLSRTTNVYKVCSKGILNSIISLYTRGSEDSSRIGWGESTPQIDEM